jgi:DNA-binding SARP family transcriptional activator/tetratricopeptide (TPR) repeat protein
MKEFRLLGSLQVLADDQPILLASNRLRVTLAMLLMSEGRVVPVEQLIDALWEDDPPATAKGQVQHCISMLRHKLAQPGDELISTSPVGYSIQLLGARFDIATFEKLSARARTQAADQAEEAVRDFRAALALWRGPAAADVQSVLAQTMATQLNEKRITILEECIQLELGLGRHRSLVAELGELTSQYPFNESFRAQHMLALYRSDRQAEALQSYQKIRGLLIAELGVEPSERLRALHQAILNREPALSLHQPIDSEPAVRQAAVGPCQLPAALADFAGRQEMLGELAELLSAAEPDGRRYLPVACLSGKGGVGKTALALHAAHSVRHLYPGGQLFIQLQDAHGQPISPMELMAVLLRSLGSLPMALPDQMSERTAVYRSLLGDRRILMVFDDVCSASQVAALIPGSPECGVIITSRHPVTALPGARHFEVEELDEATSMELLATLIGVERVGAESAAALTLVRLCGYLPLAIRIVAAKLAARRHWSISQMIERLMDESRRLDELTPSGAGIRTMLAASYNGLSRTAQQLFLRLSLLGTTDFASWVSAPLLDTDIESAVDVLEELVAARLVEVRIQGDGSSRCRLHDLIRIYALERLATEDGSADHAAALPRLLRWWLSLATDAHRRAYGGDYAVLHGCAPRWMLPEHVRDQLLSSPLNWFRAERQGLVFAITRAAQIGLDELCWDLALTAVTLFESEYLVEDWQRTHVFALESVRKAGNARGEAALLFSLGNLALHGQLSEAAHYLEPALRIFEQLGDTHGRALTLSALAFVSRLSGQRTKALALREEALECYRVCADRVGEVDALAGIGQLHMEGGNYDEAQRLLHRALGLTRSLKAPRVTAQTEHRLGVLYLRTGSLPRAELAFRSVLRAVRDEGDTVGEAYALASLGTARLRQGQYEAAEADLSAALDLSMQMASNLVRGPVFLALAELHLAQADPARAARLISEALEIFSETGPAPVWRARFLELTALADDLKGNPTAATAARHQALRLAGEADVDLLRRLSTAMADNAELTHSPSGLLAPGRPARRRGHCGRQQRDELRWEYLLTHFLPPYLPRSGRRQVARTALSLAGFQVPLSCHRSRCCRIAIAGCQREQRPESERRPLRQRDGAR